MLTLLLQVVRTESLLGLWKGMSPVSYILDLLLHPLLHNQPFLFYPTYPPSSKRERREWWEDLHCLPTCLTVAHFLCEGWGRAPVLQQGLVHLGTHKLVQLLPHSPPPVEG